MKKLVILISSIFFLSFFGNVSTAQTFCPCPERFTLTDSTCTNINIIKNGNSYFALDSIRACMGSTNTYHLNASSVGCTYPGIVYTYTVIGGTLISSSGSQFTIQWGNSSPAGVIINYNYTSGPLHCIGSFTVFAILTPNPIAAFSISPNPACFNNPTTINFNSNASVNAATYFWDFGDGFQGTGPNPTHNYALPGTYVVTLIVTTPVPPGAGGGTLPGPPTPCAACTDSVQHTLVINNLPGPPIGDCISTVCAGDEATYCTTPLACATYSWTVTGGTITSGQGTPCISVTWGSGNPQGTVSLVITGCPNYCAQGTTVNIPIIPATTTINGNDTVCVNTNETYSLPVWPGTTYFWTLSGGGTITGNNTNTPSININWTTPGTYVINCTYYDSALNCGGVGTLTVKVLPAGKITGPTKLCQGSSIVLQAMDQNNVPLPATWTASPAGITFPGGNSGSSVTISSNIPGVYTITATPAPGIVCSNPVYTVTVLPQPILNPIQGTDSICPGQTYVYSITSNTSGPFAWTISNGTASYLTINNDSAQITWGLTGPYSISITQTSTAGCVSNAQTLAVYPYPTPVISGPTVVCADNIVSYTVSNIGNHPFNWSVSPANFGTIQSGQGTNTITIKWHGSVNPGSNTVYLHFSFCKDDSIAVTINKPVTAAITSTGTLCGGGISLNPNATGTSYSWTCAENGYTSNNQIATGITQPGHYTVCITNYNGNGCTVCATYFVPDIGRPSASISASNVLNYCYPLLPNMNLVAAYVTGYNYQWYLSPSTPVGTNNSVLPINNLTTQGSYTYYCIVSLNGCTDTSNAITIIIQDCPGGGNPQSCGGAIDITGITGCNPFTVTVIATAPAGGVLVPGSETTSYNNITTIGNVTQTFDSVGYKLITVCASISLPGGGTVNCCKDTVVLVTVAAKFLANDSCGVIKLTDLSTTVFPATIGSYNWSVGAFPGNTPVPIAIASFNNQTIASPVLTITQSGQYIITQQITSGPCTVSFMDTITVTLPNANFTVNNSCVGTAVTLIGTFTYQTYFWDFGDLATSYTQNTSHAYATANTFNITHTVTDINGCTNTVVKPITIIPAPTCTISYTGPTSFCQGDSLVLNACPGLTNYQWYNNATAIGGATNSTYTAIQTGNYSFTAQNVNGCVVATDTVSVTVTPAPSATITASGACVGGTFNIGVPACNTCIFVWTDNNVVIPNFNTNQGTFPIVPGMVGTHTYSVTVTDPNTGCSATGSITVNFYNIPTVSISVVPNSPVLCSNNIYALTATSNAVSPAWAWNYNFGNIILSVTNTLNVSASGTYQVIVTDGITGCSASASQVVQPSPDLSLFPTGCDTLCDTSHVFLPLGSINGNIMNYSITWYENAPPYTNIIGTGPSLNLNSLPLGNHNISVIVINNITGCADTSNNYNIYIKHCGKCSCVGSSWDSLYFHHQPPIQDDGKAILKKGIDNIIGNPPVDTSFVCGQNLGTFDCNDPIMIFAKYKCNPSSCDSAVKYVLTGPVTMVGVMPFSTAGLPQGNYVLTITGKCGDSVCNVCQIPFTIHCDIIQPGCSCIGSSWDSLYFHHNIPGGGGNGGGDDGFAARLARVTSQSNVVTAVDTSIVCGQDLGLLNCNDPITIFAKYKCNPSSCDSAVKYVLNGPITLVGVMPLNTAGLPSGAYILTITGKCGDSICNVCIIRFRIACNPVCTCTNSNWDSLYYHHLPQDHAGLMRLKTISNNVITNPVDTSFFCGEPLGQFNCNDPIMIFAKYKCNPAACDSSVKYVLTGPVTMTGIMPFNTLGLPAGNYILTITGKCGDSVCRVCQIPFSIHCDTTQVCSCVNSSWDSLYYHHAPQEQDGRTVALNRGLNNNVIGIPPIDTSFICGQNLGTFQCNDPISIFAKYRCNPASCDSAVKYVLTGPVTMTGTMPFSTFGLPAGNYVLILTGKCGDSTCNVCDIPFKIVCDTTHQACNCNNSHWDSLYFHHGVAGGGNGPGDDGALRAILNGIIGTPPVDTAIVCGHNIGLFKCNDPITIFAKYSCNPASCDSAVKYVLTGPVTMTGTMPFSTLGLPAGNYVLILTGKCGDSTCNVCDIPFSISCDTANCCANSHWLENGPLWKNKTTNVSSLIVCNESAFTISGTNCFHPYLVKGTFVCAAGCSSTVIYQLIDSLNNIVNTSTDSLLIPPSLPSGSYSVNILAYCGSILCNTCKFTFKKICACDCDTTKTIVVTVTTAGVKKNYNCTTSPKLAQVNCLSTAILSATYACKPSTCPSVITYVLTGPYNTTTGSLPLTLSSLLPGTYSIVLNAYCNGKICKQCSFTFNVKCDSIPPQSCCPYQIAVTSSGTTTSLMPGGTGSIANSLFNITGLTGVQLSEVKAEVLTYTIGSNYNNECVNCKTLPFTWASMSSATNIGAVPAAITIFGGTTNNFMPTGTAVYQNPREVVWNNGTAFSIGGPVAINFLLPPPPIIACCELHATICVKFTFKDIRCHECEVIACINVSLTNPNASPLLFCPPIVGN